LDAGSYRLTDSSKILYEEVLNSQNQVEKRQKFSIEKPGIAKGNISFGNKGGMFKIKAYTAWLLNQGSEDVFTKEINVQEIIYPNLLLKADLTKKSYIPGDTVICKADIKELTQEPFGGNKVMVQLYINGSLYSERPVYLDKNGKADIKVALPKTQEYENASINLVVKYKGNSESLSKTVPLSIGNPDLQFMAEGGHYSNGLMSVMAYKALDKNGKPIEVEGSISDESGTLILNFNSKHDGMGKFSFIPQEGKTYFAKLTKPRISAYPIKLPEASGNGYNLILSQPDKNLVLVNMMALHTETLSIKVRARDSIYKTIPAQLIAGENIFEINTDGLPMGIAQITVYNRLGNPVLERLVFVNRHKQIKIEITSDKPKYGPRDRVKLNIKATDENGKPAPGTYSVAVIDENQYTFANDKQGHILSQIYLASELKGKIEEPDFYFKNDGPENEEALDLLMLTQGWRRISLQKKAQPLATRFKYEKLEYSGTVSKLYYSDHKTSVKNTWVKFKNTGQSMFVKDDGRFSFIVNEPIKEPLKFRINKIVYTEEFTFNQAPRLWENDSLRTLFNTAPGSHDRNEDNIIAKKEMLVKTKAVEKVVLANKDIIKMPQRGLFLGSRTDLERVAMDEVQMVASGANAKSLASVVSHTWAFNDAPDFHVYSGFPVRYSNEVYYAFGVNLDYNNTGVSPYTEFYSPQYANARESYELTDTRATIFWKTVNLKKEDATESFNFFTGDEAKPFVAIAEGISGNGAGARGEGRFVTIRPLNCIIKMPKTLQQGDKALIPILIENNGDEEMPISIKVFDISSNRTVFEDSIRIPSRQFKNLVLPFVALVANLVQYRIELDGGRYRHIETHKVKVSSKGYPKSLTVSSSEKSKTFSFQYSQAVKGTASLSFTAHPTLLSDLLEATTKMFRQPGGCFEQVSSSNYPNLVALKFLELSGYNQGNIKQTVLGYLQSGYSQLAKYETSEGGFEWFGRTPPHEGLTAYGLMQFNELKEYVDVDEKMVERTKKWLLSRSNGKGGFNLDPGKYDQFREAPEMISNAYITWALSEIGEKNLEPYIEHVKKDLKTFDAYRAALLANILLNTGNSDHAFEVINTLLKNLKSKNYSDITAASSITKSQGENLKIEVLALTALALSKTGVFQEDFEDIIAQILKKRGPYGFGSTQATILAYKALYAFVKTKSTDPTSGTITVTVNNSNPFTTSFGQGQMQAITFDIPEHYLKDGENIVSVNINGKGNLPWEISGKWMSTTPDADTACKVKLKTTYSVPKIKTGNLVQLNAVVSNSQKSPLPQSIAILSIPAGLSLIPEQLKELSDKKLFDYYEIKDHSLVLYFLELGPNESRNIPINLKADVAGNYGSAAHAAYVYYNNEFVDWQKGDEIEIME
jgi:hypothetical protein